MISKHLFVLGLLCLSLSLSAQQATSVVFAPTKQKIDYPQMSYQEKDVYIHRYVLDNKVDIELRTPGKAVFTLLDDSKVEIRGYEMSFSKKTLHSINLGKLPKGYYYIRVKKDNKSFVRRILLE